MVRPEGLEEGLGEEDKEMIFSRHGLHGDVYWYLPTPLLTLLAIWLVLVVTLIVLWIIRRKR